MKKILVLLFSLLLIAVFVYDASAQCAMCKATVEANQANQQKYGIGLNTGILYLMSVPYLAAAVIGYFWYKNAKAKKSVKPLRSI